MRITPHLDQPADFLPGTPGRSVEGAHGTHHDLRYDLTLIVDSVDAKASGLNALNLWAELTRPPGWPLPWSGAGRKDGGPGPVHKSCVGGLEASSCAAQVSPVAGRLCAARAVRQRPRRPAAGHLEAAEPPERPLCAAALIGAPAAGSRRRTREDEAWREDEAADAPMQRREDEDALPVAARRLAIFSYKARRLRVGKQSLSAENFELAGNQPEMDGFPFKR